MQPEKISECIGLINDKYIDEAANFVDSPVNDDSRSDNERMVMMKKSRIAFVIIAAAVIAAVSTIISVTAKRSISGPPGIEDELVSGYVNSYVPTEKDYIRTDIYNELNDRKAKLRQEMIANGKDAKEAYWDAESQAESEMIIESVDILKKYNKLNNDFTLNSVNNINTVMWAACELINSSGDITIRDEVFLEMFLIYNASYVDEDLRKEIDNTVPHGYKRNIFYRRDPEQNCESQHKEISS